MIPLVVAALSAATPLIPIAGDILAKWLKRYAETIPTDDPMHQEINAAIASRDGNRISQLMHKLRERKRRRPAN